MESPETAPATTYYLTVLVAEFDAADQAEAAVEPLHQQARESVSADGSLVMEDVDPGDLGEVAQAATGTAEEEGVFYEVSVVTVQDGPYLYITIALGIGEAGTLETTAAVIAAMLAAETGSEDGTFDAAGGSTGGLWEKFPVAGDAVLQGMMPESDQQLYPAA
jgi:hypothetical protein